MSEFKESALDLINDGMTQKQVCAELGISKSALQAWVRDARLREHGLEPSHDPEESRAQAAALKSIRELERENTILRETAVYLSQANSKLRAVAGGRELSLHFLGARARVQARLV